MYEVIFDRNGATVWSLDRVTERFSELVCNFIEACKNFNFDDQKNINL